MNKFYLVFGSSYMLRNHYVIVEAYNYEQARMKVIERLGSRWSNLYTEYDWKPEYFPAGAIPWDQLTLDMAITDRYGVKQCST